MNILDNILSKLGQLFNWWIIVAPWEQALRVRLGKHVTKLGAGIHFRIPWVDRVYRQSIRLRTADFDGIQTLTTSDGHVLSVSGNVKYQIDDMFTLYNTLHHAQDTVIDLVMASIAQYVATHTKENCSPANVQKHVEADVDLTQYGFGNVQINITDFAYARAFRLIQEARKYSSGDRLNTTIWEKANGDYV